MERARQDERQKADEERQRLQDDMQAVRRELMLERSEWQHGRQRAEERAAEAESALQQLEARLQDEGRRLRAAEEETRAAEGRVRNLVESLRACEQRVNKLQQAEAHLLQEAEDARSDMRASRLKLEEIERAERALARTLAKAQEKMRRREAAHDSIVLDLHRKVQDLQGKTRMEEASTSCSAQKIHRGDESPAERVRKLQVDLALCQRKLANAEDLKIKAEDRVRSLQESADTEMRKVRRVDECMHALPAGKTRRLFLNAPIDEMLASVLGAALDGLSRKPRRVCKQ